MILSTKASTQEHGLPHELHTPAALEASQESGSALTWKAHSDEEILAACELILTPNAKAEEHGLPQYLRTPAALEARHESGSTMNGQLHLELESISPSNTLAENDDSFTRSLAQESPEAPVEERQQRESTCSIRIMLPRSTGSALKSILDGLAAAGNWAFKQLQSRQTRKRLRVCETVSLGEKRFVAVVEVDGLQFLVGGAAGSVATLARLEHPPEFSEVLKRQWSQDPIQA